MKPILSVYLALLTVGTVHAQIFRSQSVTRAVAGRQAHVAGSDRGGHGHGDWNHGRRYHDSHHGHHFDRHHHGHIGFSHFGGLYQPRFYPRYTYVPSYSYYRGYGYGYPYYDGFGYGYHGPGSAATSGLLLGALAGGMIGHNSGDLHHSAWRGSAWGAGLGWLLGSVVDANRRSVVQQPAVVVQPAPTVQTQPVSAVQPQPVTIINNYYNSASPMSGVNGMFGR